MLISFFVPPELKRSGNYLDVLSRLFWNVFNFGILFIDSNNGAVYYIQLKVRTLCFFYSPGATFPSPLPGLSAFHTLICQGPISACLKMSIQGEKIVFGCSKITLLPAVLKGVLFCIYFLLCHVLSSLLSATCHPQSICIRPLRVLWQLFSLSSLDSNLPQAEERIQNTFITVNSVGSYWRDFLRADDKWLWCHVSDTSECTQCL